MHFQWEHAYGFSDESQLLVKTDDYHEKHFNLCSTHHFLLPWMTTLISLEEHFNSTHCWMLTNNLPLGRWHNSRFLWGVVLIMTQLHHTTNSWSLGHTEIILWRHLGTFTNTKASHFSTVDIFIPFQVTGVVSNWCQGWLPFYLLIFHLLKTSSISTFMHYDYTDDFSLAQIEDIYPLSTFLIHNLS